MGNEIEPLKMSGDENRSIETTVGKVLHIAVLGPYLKKDTLRNDQVQRRAAIFVKYYYKIYLKEQQHYNTVNK